MKKLKLLFASLALLVGSGTTWAEDVFKDITSGKIANPSFEEAGAVVSEKNSTGTLTTGWTIQAISFGRVAVFNSSSTATSPYNSYGPSDPSAGSYYLMIRSNETTESTDRTQSVRQVSEMSLTKNKYRVSFDYKVAQCTGNTLKLTVSALNGSTSLAKTVIDIPQVTKSTSYFNSVDWSNGSFDLSLKDTKGVKLDITCITRSKKDGSKTTFALLDNFKLEWNLTQSLTDLLSEANTFYTAEGTSYTALKAVIDATDPSSTDADNLEEQYNALAAALDLAKNHRKPWLAALTTANTNYSSAAYSNVTGSEKTALKTEIDKTEPNTADNYDTAKSALETANSTFTAAKSNYDALATVNGLITAAGTLSYADPDKKPSVSEAATSASDADTKTAAQYTALRAYYESHANAENVATASDFTSRITNREDPTTNNTTGWSINNTTGNINLRTQSGQPYTDADGTNTHSYFDSDSWGSAFTSTITQDLTLPAGDYLLTVKARGGGTTTYKVIADDDDTDIDNSGNSGGVFGNGWNDYSVKFSIGENKSVTLGIEVETGSSSNWISFSDFRLVKLDATYANSDDYDALASAISTIEGSLGFDADEYAPYNVASALATAKAFNPAEDNIQSEVQDATAALLALTTNAEEVDAVNNGNFSEDFASSGWTVSDWGQKQTGLSGNYATAWRNNPGNIQYGTKEYYTMPLKANTYYKLHAAYRKADNPSYGDRVTASVKKGEEGLTSTSWGWTESTSNWTEGTEIFKTGSAGNYTLKLQNSYNTCITGVSLRRATTAEMKALLLAEISAASATYNSGANVGTGVFQIPTTAGEAFNSAIETAQGVYDDGDATVDEVATAFENLKTAETTYASVTLNAPADGERYQIVNVTPAASFDFSGKALTFYENPSQTEGGYGYKYNFDPSANYAQGFIFTPVEGENNVYKLSFEGLDGKKKYICSQYGYYENASGDKNRIRTTENETYALKIKVVATTNDGIWKLYNTEAEKNIGTNGKDNNDFFTNADRSDIQLIKATQPSVGIDIASDVKFGTRIFPFTPTLPDGVEAYTATVAGTALMLTKEETPAANKPYILYAASGYSGDALTGWGTAAATSYTNEVLTGVYVETEAPNDSYVLLKKGDKVGFHLIDNDSKPTVGAYRAYLTAPTSARVSAFFFDEETTGIKALEALTSGEVEFFDANGVKQPALRKGLNIVKTKNGKTHKVMVK